MQRVSKTEKHLTRYQEESKWVPYTPVNQAPNSPKTRHSLRNSEKDKWGDLQSWQKRHSKTETAVYLTRPKATLTQSGISANQSCQKWHSTKPGSNTHCQKRHSLSETAFHKHWLKTHTVRNGILQTCSIWYTPTDPIPKREIVTNHSGRCLWSSKPIGIVFWPP